MSEAQKGKHSRENSSNKVPVVCLNLKTVFITKTAAAEATRLSATTVADIYNRKINYSDSLIFFVAMVITFSINSEAGESSGKTSSLDKPYVSS